MAEGSASVTTLKSLLEAFNAHDLDRIMSFFAEDCILEMPRGPAPWGTRYVGSAAVREGLRSRLAGIPDVRYTDDTHFTAGDVGVSQWTLRGTTVSGETIEVKGCDFFTFAGDRKSSRRTPTGKSGTADHLRCAAARHRGRGHESSRSTTPEMRFSSPEVHSASGIVR